MGKSAGSPPPAPDYKGAAEATGKSNLESVRAQTAANRINQFTPYGNLTYTQDPNAEDPDHGWSSTLQLSPEQQALLDQQNKTSLGLSGLADRGLGYVSEALSNRINAGSLPKVDALDTSNPTNDAYNQMMARYQPQMDQSRKALDTQLANQGVLQGSEAYNNAIRTQQQGENDLKSQAAISSIGLGNQQLQQRIAMQNQQMNFQNQQMGLQTSLQNNPINVLNAVRSGSQVTNPTFTNTPQQQNAGGVDYTGAMKGQTDYAQGLYNSQVASDNANTSAMMSGLGTLGMGAMMFL